MKATKNSARKQTSRKPPLWKPSPIGQAAGILPHFPFRCVTGRVTSYAARWENPLSFKFFFFSIFGFGGEGYTNVSFWANWFSQPVFDIDIYIAIEIMFLKLWTHDNLLARCIHVIYIIYTIRIYIYCIYFFCLWQKTIPIRCCRWWWDPDQDILELFLHVFLLLCKAAQPRWQTMAKEVGGGERSKNDDALLVRGFFCTKPVCRDDPLTSLVSIWWV